MDGELIGRSSRVITRILERPSTIADHVTGSLIFFKCSLSVEAAIRDVSGRVQIIQFKRDRTGRNNAFHQHSFHRGIVIDRVRPMVVQFYRFHLVKGPTNAFVLIGRRFANGKRGNGLSMVISPETKLIDLLRAASLIHIMYMHPTISRLSNL